MEIEKSINNNNNQIAFTQANDSLKNSKNPDTSKVEVALRVRPFIQKEIIDNESKCVVCYPESNQVIVGKDRQFVFDRVFDENAKQQEVYEYCAKGLVISCLNGYNATVLAYGQTGSGKTYTMGSTTSCENKEQNIGIIPRVIKDLFDEIQKKKITTQFLVKVSFLEIHNEDIHDLLDPSLTNTRMKMNQFNANKNQITIREEKNGSIAVYGIQEETVGSYEEIAACLERGSLYRTTASTLMNETSSRSHAIFTISIDQNQINEITKDIEDNTFMTAKFHFVDLAGSERVKKTGATGAVLREGININRGLLALGNVISALTDDAAKIFHIPYRESKLTRILQDSLGGNSRTIMIACISPAESNFEESLNTLKYASRARNIKNKPIVNRDPQSALITQLKQQIFELQNEIMSYKRMLISHGASSGTQINLNDIPSQHLSKSSTMPLGIPPIKNVKLDNITDELKDYKIKLFQHEKQLNNVLAELQTTKKALSESEIIAYSMQKERDLLKILNDKYKSLLQEHNIDTAIDENLIEIESKNITQEYVETIEKLKKELNEQNKVNKELQYEYESLMKSSNKEHELLVTKTKNMHELQRKIKQLEKTNKQLQQQIDSKKQQSSDIVEMPNTNDGNQQFDSFQQQLQQPNNDKIDEKQNGESESNDDDNTEDNIEEDDSIEKEFESYSQLHRREMLLVDGTLTEKEELLKNITQNQIMLEKNLVEEMKNQYHHKILNLESELKVLEKQRDEAINKANTSGIGGTNDSDKILNNYKQKLAELENKMKEFKKKEKDQTNLLKLVESQQHKIKELDEEIRKMKAQKLELAKKMREEIDKFEKWKQSRQRELLQIKKKNLEKDAEIQKLKIENKKKDMLYKKKTEELLAKHISMDLLRQIQVTPSRVTQNGMVTSRDKSKSVRILREKIPNIIEDAPTLPENTIRELVDLCTQKLIENLEISYAIQKEEENLRTSENELEIEKKKYAEIFLKKETLELEKQGNPNMDIETEENMNIQLQEITLELDDLSPHIETLEEKIKYNQAKINELTQELSLKPEFNAEEMLLNNKNYMNTNMIIKILLAKFISANFDLLKIQETIKKNMIDMYELKKKLEECEQKSQLAELQFEINLTKLKKEQENRQMIWMKNDEEDNDINLSAYNSNTQVNQDNNSNRKENLSTSIILTNNEINKPTTTTTITNTLTQNPQALQSMSTIQSIQGNTNQRNDSHDTKNPSLNNSGNMANNQKKKAHGNTNTTTNTTPNISNNNNNTSNKMKNVMQSIIERISPQKKGMISNIISNNQKSKVNNESLVEINKRLEKNLFELKLKHKESEKQIDVLKRKCDILQLKCDQLKKQISKEKTLPVLKIQDEQGSVSSIIKPQLEHHMSVPNIIPSGSRTNSSNNNLQVPQTNVNYSPVGTGAIGPTGYIQPKLLTLQKNISNITSNIGSISNNSNRNSGIFGINSNNEQNTKYNISSFKDRRKEEKGHKIIGISKPSSPGEFLHNIEESKANRLNINQMLMKANTTMISQDNHSTLNTSRLINQRLSISQISLNESMYSEDIPRLQLNVTNSNNPKEANMDITKDNASINTSNILDEVDPASIIEKLKKLKKKSNMEYGDNKWKCVGAWEPHNGFVYTTVSLGNMLYTSSNKTFKVWSLDNMSLISEVNSNGFITSMLIWPERNILATACDKTINLWDLISLQSICTLKSKDEIRTMHVCNDMLFTAGKGSQFSGSIFSWDLRSSNAIDELEKNQDVFSLISHENILYYGCRNNQIRRINLSNMELLEPLETSHTDIVTTLSVVKNFLISGSRDKTLKLWSLDSPIQDLRDSIDAHNDWVNVAETNISKSMLYSGSKNGIVKIWGIEDNKLQCLTKINAHSQSVNSICRLYDDHENMFVTASSDKKIKLWKPMDDYYINFNNKQDEDIKIEDITNEISNQNQDKISLLNSTRSYDVPSNINQKDVTDITFEKN